MQISVSLHGYLIASVWRHLWSAAFKLLSSIVQILLGSSVCLPLSTSVCRHSGASVCRYFCTSVLSLSILWTQFYSSKIIGKNTDANLGQCVKVSKLWFTIVQFFLSNLINQWYMIPKLNFAITTFCSKTHLLLLCWKEALVCFQANISGLAI